MKKQVKSVSILLIVLLFISISVNVVLALDNGQSEPGSEQDPLVSKSYVDSVLSQDNTVIQQLKAEIETLKGKLGETGAAADKGYEAVTVEAGQTILTGNGTEIIFRQGKATAIAGSNGKLIDVATAKELAAGTAAVINHLLISSREDGRGFKAVSKSYFLVRGSYKTSGNTTSNEPAGSGNTPAKETTNPPPTNTAVKSATVSASSLNIRSGPGTENKLAGSAVKGEKVTVLAQSGEWTKIKKTNGIEGWVLSIYLAISK